MAKLRSHAPLALATVKHSRGRIRHALILTLQVIRRTEKTHPPL